TAVLAEYIATPQANVAVMFFSATSLLLNLNFCLWWVCMFRPVRLVSASMSHRMVKRANIQMTIGALLYLGTTAISYWFPVTALLVMFACQGLWIGISVGENE